MALIQHNKRVRLFQQHCCSLKQISQENRGHSTRRKFYGCAKTDAKNRRLVSLYPTACNWTNNML